MDSMKRSTSGPFPVTVTHLPVVRCRLCRKTVAHQPGQASAALTKHYVRVHGEVLDAHRQNIHE